MSTFYMLIGLPGSGKSKVAEEMKKDDSFVIHSSDAIRKELYGDESIQKDPHIIFQIMLERTIKDLKEGKNVIYDATNLNRKKRMGTLKSLPRDVSKKAIIVWARIETCKVRDNQRLRNVGDKIIDNMVKKFQCPNINEGWGEIEIINNDIARYSYEDFDLDINHDNPHHNNTIRQHINNVTKCINNNLDPSLDYFKDLLLAIARYHDIGKPFCKTFINSKGEQTDIAHYYDHQNVSSYLTLGIDEDPPIGISRLNLAWYVNMHMEPFFQETNYYKNNVDIWDKSTIELFNKFDQQGA